MRSKIRGQLLTSWGQSKVHTIITVRLKKLVDSFQENFQMDGKICVITGATSGIGIETAFNLAQKGARLVLACRNLSKGETVARSTRTKSGNGRIDVSHCDLASLDSVRNFVNDFKRRYERLDVLINNAGLFSLRRQTTMDGIELTFETNYLGPFLLTYLLWQKKRWRVIEQLRQL